MDGSRFDELAKNLVTRADRRRVVRGVGGALAVLLGAPLGGELVAAAGRCKTVGQACKTSEDCCPGPTRNGNVFCSAAGRKQKTCQTCPNAQPTACNGGCVNTSSDASNCGDCGNQCPSDGNPCTDDTCTEGRCTHPNKTNATTCTTCQASTCTCQNGTCASCDPDQTPCGSGSTCCSGICCSSAGVGFCPPGIDACCGTVCPA